MTDMAAEMPVTLPVRLRVGDSPELEAGTLTLDPAHEYPAALADFLRALADAIERLPADGSGPEAGGGG